MASPKFVHQISSYITPRFLEVYTRLTTSVPECTSSQIASRQVVGAYHCTSTSMHSQWHRWVPISQALSPRVCPPARPEVLVRFFAVHHSWEDPMLMQRNWSHAPTCPQHNGWKRTTQNVSGRNTFCFSFFSSLLGNTYSILYIYIWVSLFPVTIHLD